MTGIQVICCEQFGVLNWMGQLNLTQDLCLIVEVVPMDASWSPSTMDALVTSFCLTILSLAIYRGEMSFCSFECRQHKMNQDELRDEGMLESKKKSDAAHSTTDSQSTGDGQSWLLNDAACESSSKTSMKVPQLPRKKFSLLLPTNPVLYIYHISCRHMLVFAYILCLWIQWVHMYVENLVIFLLGIPVASLFPKWK